MKPDNLKLNGLRPQLNELLTTFADRLCTTLGANLESITLVGSALTDDFTTRSDINTVLVLSRRDLPSLKAIASQARWMARKKLAVPLIMTTEYIERSRDTFGIELLDFQLTHKTILGDDPFESLSFDKSDVRLQAERELKATLIRLRQGYISFAGNKRRVRDIVSTAVSSLLPLLRAMLWLRDIERPATAQPTIDRADEALDINLKPLRDVRKWRTEKPKPTTDEIEDAFESVYTVVDQLAIIVDKLEV